MTYQIPERTTAGPVAPTPATEEPGRPQFSTGQAPSRVSVRPSQPPTSTRGFFNNDTLRLLFEMLKPFDPARANAIFARIPTGGGVWTPIGEAIYDEREAVGEVENALSLGNPWLALKTADRVVDLTFRASLLVPIAARLAQRDLDLALDVVESIFIEEYRRKALTDVADVVLPRLPARGY